MLDERILGIRDSSVASCYHIALSHIWFLSLVKQRRARLVRGWVIVTDRELSHMHGFSAKVPIRVTLIDE